MTGKQKIDKVYETNKKEGPDKSKFPELAKQIADLDAEIKKGKQLENKNE